MKKRVGGFSKRSSTAAINETTLGEQCTNQIVFKVFLLGFLTLSYSTILCLIMFIVFMPDKLQGQTVCVTAYFLDGYKTNVLHLLRQLKF